MKDLTRALAIVALAASTTLITAVAVAGAPKPAATATPAAAASATPAPLPTATPEPPEVAVPRLEAKLKTDPNDRATLMQLAQYYLQGGRPDKAIVLTHQLLSLGEKTAQAYYLDGLANQSTNHVKEAIDDFEQATNREPTNAQILLTLTSLYIGTGRVADAERVAKRATTFNASDSQSWVNYGLVLAQEKKYEEARQSFEQAAKLDPKDAEPVVFEARSYVDQNAIALAVQLYDRAIAIDPKNTDALLGKARLMAGEHNVKDAIAIYDQLLPMMQSDEGKAAIAIEEMRVYQNEKMTAEATAAVLKLVQTYPNVPVVHLAYGDYLAGNKDLNGAEREWTLALGSKRDNPDALGRLAELAASQNKLAQAAELYGRLAEVVPNDPGVQARLGQVQAQLGHFERARDAYRRAFELSGAAQALAGVAATDYRLRNYKECSLIADKLDQGAADFVKQTPEILYVMGKCYAADRQRDKARSAYTRLLGFVKPNSTTAKEVQKDLADLNVRPKPAATAKASGKN